LRQHVRAESKPPRRARGAARSWLWHLFRVIRGHYRLATSFAVGALTTYGLSGQFNLGASILIGWNAGAWLYFASSAVLISMATPESLRRKAKTTDEGKFLVLSLTALAGLAAIGAIGMELSTAMEFTGLNKALHVALAVTTIVDAWLLIHLVFAFHYAHEYYDEFSTESGTEPSLRGGLVFPETENPDYYDFIYFSYVIGTSAQTADIAISSRPMRRTVIVHCILAFFFNSAVLALTINIAGNLI
jgi:uncharacterized membrane protein